MEQEHFSLKGRIALVTGGSGVLGFAMARGLAQAGATVIINGRNADKAEEKAATLKSEGFTAHSSAFDAADEGQVEESAARLGNEIGIPSILVNAAGGNLPEATAVPGKNTFFDLSSEPLRSVFEQNLMAGCLIPTRVFGRMMKEDGITGSVINISSVAASLPLTRVVGYAAAKAAVENATKWLAVHFAKELGLSIRVNAIMPGFFLTEQNRFLLTEEDGSLTERGKQIIDQTPLGRFGKPEELIGAAVYLASDASSFVTGSVLAVDGGFTAFSGV